MIDGQFHQAGFTAPAKSTGLQSLEWPVLAAKLAAAHDLRGAFMGRIADTTGNFSRFTSGTHTADDQTINETKPSVNLVGSADEKRSGSRAVATKIDYPSVFETNMAPSDREL
ncbi:hypothetical protein GCM10023115_03670 [Pontixanthobacter gangjinensis]|uniref:Uncharacterized protein n=1 Tax=Pontixanthobacter gangjinensis TaxID=1028742 RepID=A0A6I4SKF7_9SPHN|nr:hypothetical protein [Pontixanthobacter gangjinensis]MXO55620.1 hypothetical protein [Pontixanthobacter gangjinensis]